MDDKLRLLLRQRKGSDLVPEKTGFGPDFDRQYHALPESLKMLYTPKEYAWLGWEQRQRLTDDECYPDAPED